jgi:hypothetical protein
MIAGLEKAYGVTKQRWWWNILAIAFGLTFRFNHRRDGAVGNALWQPG